MNNNLIKRHMEARGFTVFIELRNSFNKRLYIRLGSITSVEEGKEEDTTMVTTAEGKFLVRQRVGKVINAIASEIVHLS